ncbi:SCO family protein [Bacillus sp. FJAT-42376]|uniref:SCO family protein n=1 Tax=Bacillus sp. FJAT-42376 TaxID=2014076 RepID=UPI000F504A76|nr:SCO family protein [Bacillus sp. FJAT-42376]AZB44867.1 SCO family protein [Bacillus sp. FJAT-42376]
MKSISSVENFRFTDQEGEPFGLSDLKDKVWIANFIFTSCTTVCPPMTAHMKKLQDMSESQGVPVEIVSFSVDPSIDQPEKLKQFARQFGSSFENWHFLTGYSQKEIEDFSLKSFKTLVKKPESEDQVIHGTSFYLVNKKGEVVQSYSGVENPPYGKMMKDLKRLQQQ